MIATSLRLLIGSMFFIVCFNSAVAQDLTGYDIMKLVDDTQRRTPRP